MINRHDLFLGAGRSVMTGAQVREYMKNKQKFKVGDNCNTKTENASSR